MEVTSLAAKFGEGRHGGASGARRVAGRRGTPLRPLPGASLREVRHRGLQPPSSLGQERRHRGSGRGGHVDEEGTGRRHGVRCVGSFLRRRRTASGGERPLGNSRSTGSGSRRSTAAVRRACCHATPHGSSRLRHHCTVRGDSGRRSTCAFPYRPRHEQSHPHRRAKTTTRAACTPLSLSGARFPARRGLAPLAPSSAVEVHTGSEAGFRARLSSSGSTPTCVRSPQRCSRLPRPRR